MGSPPVIEPVAGEGYSAEELVELSSNLLAMQEQINAGHLAQAPHHWRLLAAIHRGLFADIRGHAGNIRQRAEGSEYLTFGGWRSVHRDEVVARLDEVDSLWEKGRMALDWDAGNYAEQAMGLVADVHARIIRIHPFEDGNGRTSRLFMDSQLIALGLLPVPIKRPKAEYLSVLNHYVKAETQSPGTGSIEPLKRFLMECLADHIQRELGR